MTADSFDTASSQINKTRKPFGIFTSIASRQVIEFLLRSNYGAFAGGSFTLASAVNEWLSLLYVEDRTGSEQGNAVRLTDAWVYRMALVTKPRDPLLRAEASFAARTHEVFDLAAEPLGLTLIPPPMGPADSTRWPRDNVKVILDPAGADIELSHGDLRVEFDQGLVHEWTMTSGMDVRKGGKAALRVSFSTRVNDQGWARVSAALAGTSTGLRIRAETPTGSLDILVHSLSWDAPEEIGFAGRGMKVLRLGGQARIAGSGSAVDIALAGT